MKSLKIPSKHPVLPDPYRPTGRDVIDLLRQFNGDYKKALRHTADLVHVGDDGRPGGFWYEIHKALIEAVEPHVGNF